MESLFPTTEFQPRMGADERGFQTTGRDAPAPIWSAATHGKYRCTSAADCDEANRVRAFVEMRTVVDSTGSPQGGATFEEVAGEFGISVERAAAVCAHLVDSDGVLREGFALRDGVSTGVVMGLVNAKCRIPKAERKNGTADGRGLTRISEAGKS